MALEHSGGAAEEILHDDFDAPDHREELASVIERVHMANLELAVRQGVLDLEDATALMGVPNPMERAAALVPIMEQVRFCAGAKPILS